MRRNWGFKADVLREPDGTPYMSRWVFQTPWFGLRLHKIWKSDSGRDFHDHPFAYTSFILSGGYVEERPCARWGQGAVWGRFACDQCGETPTYVEQFKPGSVVRREAYSLHRLKLTKPAWTFVVTGPYKREWGFMTQTGWVPAKLYHTSFYRPPDVKLGH